MTSNMYASLRVLTVVDIALNAMDNISVVWKLGTVTVLVGFSMMDIFAVLLIVLLGTVKVLLLSPSITLKLAKQ